MYAQVDAGALSGFKNLILKLFADLCNDFLDAGRMDTAVNYELMQCQTGNFPSYRIET